MWLEEQVASLLLLEADDLVINLKMTFKFFMAKSEGKGLQYKCDMHTLPQRGTLGKPNNYSSCINSYILIVSFMRYCTGLEFQLALRKSDSQSLLALDKSYFTFLFSWSTTCLNEKLLVCAENLLVTDNWVTLFLRAVVMFT